MMVKDRPRFVRQNVAERLLVATRHVTRLTPGNPDQICDEGIRAVGWRRHGMLFGRAHDRFAQNVRFGTPTGSSQAAQ
jgi:hypothetical protein